MVSSHKRYSHIGYYESQRERERQTDRDRVRETDRKREGKRGGGGRELDII